MTYRGPWNAAGTRHRQTPRKYRACGPVGEKRMLGAPRATDMVCHGCGYHVCSCEKSKGDWQVHRPGEPNANERKAVDRYLVSRIADEVLKQAMPEQVAHPDGPNEEAHRASMQPEGGTAAETCNHTGIGLPGCEVCDPLAKVRQAGERVVRTSLRLGDEVIYASATNLEHYGMRGKVTHVSGDRVTVSCTMGSLVGFKASDFQLASLGVGEREALAAFDLLRTPRVS